MGDAAGWNTWFGEQLKAIEMSRDLSKSGDAIFETVDWDTGIAIAGHSMGGQATAWSAHSGKMHVYYPEGAAGEKFPLISYAHGLAGGSVDLLGYAKHFSQLASYGFVVVAPNTCNFGCKDAVKSPYADCNEVTVTGKNPDAAGWNTWFGEQLKAIEMSRDLS